MRIAGMVPKKQNTEVEYVCSVHTVSRWIHELCERPDFQAVAPAANLNASEAKAVAA